MEEYIKKEPEENMENPSVNSGQIQNDLEECKLKCEEYLNNWKRAVADLINYKKDEMERMAKLMEYGREDMIEKILPIFDSIYLAATAFGGVPSEGGKKQELDKWFEGFSQIKKQIEDFLAKEGIEEIKTVGNPPSPEASEGQRKFDPSLMEVVEEVMIEGIEPNMVVEELQKGYKMNDKVLRPAKVRITK